MWISARWEKPFSAPRIRNRFTVGQCRSRGDRLNSGSFDGARLRQARRQFVEPIVEPIRIPVWLSEGMLDMDRGIAAEQIDFVRGYSKRDRGLGDVGTLDLILDAISSLVGDPHRFR